MSKNDLTQYTDSELSLWVFNDEGLYRQRHSEYLKETLRELFIFTNAQWEELQQDLADDKDSE